MLPTHLFDRLTDRTSSAPAGRPTDRRQANRYPQDAAVALYPITNGNVGDRVEARMTEFSTSGVKIEVGEGTVEIHGLFALAVGEGERTTATSAVLLCNARYQLSTRSGAMEVGAKIVAILSPTHVVAPGEPMGTCRWIPCADVTPADPVPATPVAA